MMMVVVMRLGAGALLQQQRQERDRKVCAR